MVSPMFLPSTSIFCNSFRIPERFVFARITSCVPSRFWFMCGHFYKKVYLFVTPCIFPGCGESDHFCDLSINTFGRYCGNLTKLPRFFWACRDLQKGTPFCNSVLFHHLTEGRLFCRFPPGKERWPAASRIPLRPLFR